MTERPADDLSGNDTTTWKPFGTSRLRLRNPIAQLGLLAVAAASGAFARTAFNPIQEAMQGALGFSDNQIATLQGPALALPIALVGIPLGLLIDRQSRSKFILCLALINVVAGLVVTMVSNFAILFAARCLTGFVGFAIGPAVFSMLADLFPADRRGRATTIVAVCQVGAMAAAFALGGALLAAFDGESDAWRWAMRGMIAPLVVALLACLLLREPPRTAVDNVQPSALSSIRQLWTYRLALTPLLFGISCLDLAYSAVLGWGTPALIRDFGLPPDRSGAIMASALLISGLLGPIVGGLLADWSQRRGGPRATMTMLSVVAVAGVPGALFVMTSITWAGVLLALYLTIVGGMLVICTTLILNVVPNELRGLCMGISLSIGAVFGTALAPVGVSMLAAAIGGAAMIGSALSIICVGSNILAGACFLFAGRRTPPGPRIE